MEVAVDNIESAVQAVQGGAIRLELCSALSEGGLTPTVGFLKFCKEQLKITVFPMIRCRGGDFMYTPEEMEIMAYDLKVLKENGADGFVFGILDKDRQLDKEKCQELIELAKPKPCTLHRAFDEVVNCEEALETAIQLGFTRILTSGQEKDTLTGINTLKSLMNLAHNRIIIMPGGGINCSNVEAILLKTKAKEFHGSAKEKRLIHGHCSFITDRNNVAYMINVYNKINT